MALRQSHFLIASWVMPPLAIRKCVCPNAQICSVIQKIVTKYLLSFQIACLVRSLEFNKIFDLLSAHVAFLTPPLDCSGTVNTKQVSTWPCCSSNFANFKSRNLANWAQRKFFHDRSRCRSSHMRKFWKTPVYGGFGPRPRPGSSFVEIGVGVRTMPLGKSLTVRKYRS